MLHKHEQPLEKDQDCLYQIEKLTERILKLEYNSNTFHDIITKMQQEIDQIVSNGEKTGKFYKIPAVQLNKIHTLLSHINKYHNNFKNEKWNE